MTQTSPYSYHPPQPTPCPPPPTRRPSKTAWMMVAILAVVGVIGLVIFAAVASRSGGLHSSTSITSVSPTISKFTCPETRVPPSPRVDPDCYFVFMMTQRGGISSSSGVPVSLIREAHEACTAMDQAAIAGNEPRELAGLAEIRRAHPELSISDAAYFATIAIAAYCPWNAGN